MKRRINAFSRVIALALIVIALAFSTTLSAQAQSAVALVPGTVTVSPAMEEAVKSAIAQAPDMPEQAVYFAITDAQPYERWTFVSVIGLARLNESLGWVIDDGAWFGLILVEETARGLAAAPEGTAAFSELLAQIPDEVLAPASRQNLDPLSPARRNPMYASSNRFPWQAGTSMFYGSLGVHENGFASVVTGWKAVDVLSDGDTGAGHAPNRILAVTTDSITYKCSDGTSVAVRMGNFFYTHFLNNANLYVGKTFNQGDEMGQAKPGTFSASCGWTNQGSTWFHLHWGFPNADQYIENWTLSMSTQNWTNGGTTVTPGNGWIKAGEEAACTTNADQVTLYEHTNYGGTCKTLGIGDYTDSGAMGFPNETVSSLKVGGSVKAVLYENTGYSGASEEFTGDDSDLTNNSIGNDRVSSLKVQWRGCSPNSDQVAIFEHSDFGGACKILGVGDYPDATSTGLANDAVSSIKVGSSVKAILYENAGYGGAADEFYGDDSNLSDNSIGNDRLSSIKVQTRPVCTPGSLPPKPVVLFPLDNSNPDTTTPQLDWEDVNSAYCVDYYHVQIYDDTGVQVDVSWPGASAYAVPSGKLITGKKYEWYVWAHNSIGFGEASLQSFWTGTPPTQTLAFKSVAAYDGWTLEYSETSGTGGSANYANAVIRLGDDRQDRQYRGFLHFDTSALPDDAIVTAVNLSLRKQGLAGINPFTTHGSLLVDMIEGAFGGTNALSKTDFQASASLNQAGTVPNAPVNNWYAANLNSAAFPFLNLTGPTQFRLRFEKDDNDDRNVDYVAFYSGNTATVSYRPILTITYYVP